MTNWNKIIAISFNRSLITCKIFENKGWTCSCRKKCYRNSIDLFFLNCATVAALSSGGGATQPLPRDGGVEELHGDPTVGPRPTGCTNVSPPQRDGAATVPLTRDGLKWRGNFPEGPDHPATPNRLVLSRHWCY